MTSYTSSGTFFAREEQQRPLCLCLPGPGLAFRGEPQATVVQPHEGEEKGNGSQSTYQLPGSLRKFLAASLSFLSRNVGRRRAGFAQSKYYIQAVVLREAHRECL